MSNSSITPPIFSGEYRHKIDEKNRVTIPSCWRNEDSDEFFLIISPTHNCISAMPPSVFTGIREETKARFEPAKYQDFIRNLYASAIRVVTDKQGRLLLNEEQSKRAGLEGEVMLCGALEKFEIWNLSSWEKFKKAQKSTFEGVAKELGL